MPRAAGPRAPGRPLDRPEPTCQRSGTHRTSTPAGPRRAPAQATTHRTRRPPGGRVRRMTDTPAACVRSGTDSSRQGGRAAFPPAREVPERSVHANQVGGAGPNMEVVHVLGDDRAAVERRATTARSPRAPDWAGMLRPALDASAYHSHTSVGSRPNAPAVASSSARNWRHSPPLPRKVGTPLAAETPAPVRIVTPRRTAEAVGNRRRSIVVAHAM